MNTNRPVLWILPLLFGLLGCGTQTVDSNVDSTCFASCVGYECGGDGCGGTCGTCSPGLTCNAGLCQIGTPDDSEDVTTWDVSGLGDSYVAPEIEDPEADSDDDGIKDGEDNCPFDYNPAQLNFDNDPGGDSCDPDDDNDGVPDEFDCNPKDASMGEQGIEICDGLDNDCDGSIDEDADGCIPLYEDQDGDNYGVLGTQICACPGATPNRAVKYGDCNDLHTEVNPGAAEICDDIDNDCDGNTDEGCDADGDGWCNDLLPIVGTPAVCVHGPGDCYDSSPAAFPGAYEDPGDGIDNDCDGIVDEAIECPGPCTGHTTDAYLCALEMCFDSGTLSNPNFYSPTGDSISTAWAAVSHFGSASNDLTPQGGTSYALLATGPATGTFHSEDLSGYGTANDPYSSDSYETHDNVEFRVTLTAPSQALGFSIDYVFMSEEYEEFIGSSFNDKFYIFLTAPNTTNNQKTIINFTDCSSPNSYHDFVDPDTGKKQCYIAINTAYSEPCPNAPTNISGTGFECGFADENHGSSTGWLVTSWPIEPNETFDLVFHIHDTSDGIYDSLVVLDNFHWLSTPFTPGTSSHSD